MPNTGWKPPSSLQLLLIIAILTPFRFFIAYFTKDDVEALENQKANYDELFKDFSADYDRENPITNEILGPT